MLMSSSKAFGVTPDCRPGFCGLPPLHVSGASLGCVGSCIITSVGIHTYSARSSWPRILGKAMFLAKESWAKSWQDLVQDH